MVDIAIAHADTIAPALEFQTLSAGYGPNQLAIEELSVRIESGKRVALIGPNGAGKSTLFRSIVGLISIQSGCVLIKGSAQAESRRLAAYVPQTETVDWDFPVSVLDVTLMGLARQIGWLRLPGAVHRKKALDALE